MDSNQKMVVLLCWILISISGCESLQQTETVAPAAMDMTVSPTLIVETQQPIITQLPTSISTITLSQPTLSTTEAEIKLLELLNNTDCRLPCFLGIIPGKTSQVQALSILQQFDEISPGTEIKLKRDDMILSLDVISEGGYNNNSEIVKWTDAKMLVYRELDGSIEKNYQSPFYAEYFRNYTLASLLSIYGPPDQAYVFLDTGIADMGLGIDLYLLHLDYSEQGWVAHLEMPLRMEGGLYQGCLSEAFTTLRLWSPDNPARDYELDTNVLFTIEEATGLTLEDFYQRFKDPANTTCLETPVNIHK